MQRSLSYASILCCLLLAVEAAPVGAASAVSVPPEARDTAAGAAAAAQEVLDQAEAARAKDEAVFYVQKAAAETDAATEQVTEAEQNLEEAETEAQDRRAEAYAAGEAAKAAAAEAARLSDIARQAETAAQTAAAEAERLEARLQAEEAALAARRPARSPERTASPAAAAPSAAKTPPTSSLEESDELLRLEKEWRQLEQQQKAGEAARSYGVPQYRVEAESEEADEPEGSVDWSPAEAAYARAAELQTTADDAGAAATEAEQLAEEQTTAAETAATAAAEAKQAVLDAELAVKDARQYAAQAAAAATQTKRELAELVYQQEHPKGSHSMTAETHYYGGNGGYQLTQPVTFAYWQKNTSFSIATKYIVSSHTQDGESGRVAGFGDTVLTLGKQEENEKRAIAYSLAVNVPTGKAALSWSERYARMNEDLWEVSQFGKGWQLTPGVEYSWKIGKEDRWTLGSTYAFNGSYDPTSDIANDTISPGNEWRKYLRWQHAGQDWQFVGEVGHTNTGEGKVENGETYHTGEQWDYRLTYHKRLPQQQQLMLYYWREAQAANGLPAEAGNSVAHYAGAMLSRKIDNSRTLRYTLDVMRADGSRYDRIYNFIDGNGEPQYLAVNVDGRTKYTLGIGCDWQFNPQNRLSLDVQHFIMQDGSSTLGDAARRYQGTNILLTYQKTL